MYLCMYVHIRKTCTNISIASEGASERGSEREREREREKSERARERESERARERESERAKERENERARAAREGGRDSMRPRKPLTRHQPLEPHEDPRQDALKPPSKTTNSGFFEILRFGGRIHQMSPELF